MKDLKISTELASEVLGFKVVYIESCDHRDNIIGIWIDLNSKPLIEINIYEFAFKCKEWLKNKVSNLCSGFDNGHRSFCHIENLNTEDSFYEDSEVEAIIKACEWILNKVNK